MNPIRNIYWTFRRLLGDSPEKANARFHHSNAPVLFRKYFESHPIRKLQIGAEAQVMEGWLNVDLFPKSREIAFMDATRTFPFENETFDFVYSEHMIEHIHHAEGAFMLRECYRVLKPGGKIRISTPDLHFLIHLFQTPDSKLHQDYITFSARYFPGGQKPNPGMVVNNFFRDWGHRFIYDEETLRSHFVNAGFRNIQRHEVHESPTDAFKNIERHGNEISDVFNRLESFVLEAEK